MNVLRRRDARAIVDGTYTGHDHEAVSAFVDGLRDDAASYRAPAPRPRLTATLDGRRPLRSASDPIPAPMAAPLRARPRALRPATIAIASGAVFFGGLATAGALPAPLQHASANLTKHVGVSLPGATPARPPAPHPTVDAGSASPTGPTASTARHGASAATGTTPGTTTRGATTPSTAPAPGTPAVGSVPVEVPARGSGPITVEVPPPGQKPPVVVTLPSLPIELPPLTLPTVPHHHDR